MKNLFNRILRRWRNLKKLMCQIEIAREELRETNEELETQKKKLEKTEDMLHETQEMFADASYTLRLTEEKVTNIYNKQCEESKKLDDIIGRYKVMYSDYKNIYDNLERYKRRTLNVENQEPKHGITYKDVETWMKTVYITTPDTGKKMTIAAYCYDALRRKKGADIDDGLEVWGGIQNEVRDEMNRIEAAAPEVF